MSGVAARFPPFWGFFVHASCAVKSFLICIISVSTVVITSPALGVLSRKTALAILLFWAVFPWTLVSVVVLSSWWWWHCSWWQWLSGLLESPAASTESIDSPVLLSWSSQWVISQCPAGFMLCGAWFTPWKFWFWSEYDFSNVIFIKMKLSLLWTALSSDNNNACFPLSPILLWSGTQDLLHGVPEVWEQHRSNVLGRARLRTAALGTSHRDIPYVRQQSLFKNCLSAYTFQLWASRTRSCSWFAEGASSLRMIEIRQTLNGNIPVALSVSEIHFPELCFHQSHTFAYTTAPWFGCLLTGDSQTAAKGFC